jgi:hypothetical protein
MEDDTGTPAVEEVVKPHFTPEQEQYMNQMFEKQSEKLTSHFGRIVTKQFEEKFMPQINDRVDPDKLNEQLSNKMFGGDVVGTVNQILDARERNLKELSEKKQALLKTEMEKYESQPMYNETKLDIEKLASEALAKGFPPAPAVELAYEKATKNFVLNKDPDYKLSMSGSGKITPSNKKTAKIPAALKAAAQRDISDGIFKDEAEYLANLSPNIKEKYGI